MPAPPEGPGPALFQPVLLKRPFHVGERGQDAFGLLGTDLGHLAGGGVRRLGARTGILGCAAAAIVGGGSVLRRWGAFRRGRLFLPGLPVPVPGGRRVLGVLPLFPGALRSLPLLVPRLLILLLLLLILLFLIL